MQRLDRSLLETAVGGPEAATAAMNLAGTSSTFAAPGGRKGGDPAVILARLAGSRSTRGLAASGGENTPDYHPSSEASSAAPTPATSNRGTGLLAAVTAMRHRDAAAIGTPVTGFSSLAAAVGGLASARTDQPRVIVTTGSGEDQALRRAVGEEHIIGSSRRMGHMMGIVRATAGLHKLVEAKRAIAEAQAQALPTPRPGALLKKTSGKPLSVRFLDTSAPAPAPPEPFVEEESVEEAEAGDEEAEDEEAEGESEDEEETHKSEGEQETHESEGEEEPGSGDGSEDGVSE
jgi:hypothetical protein